MIDKVLISQLLAARAAIDAALCLLKESMGPEETPGVCTHPDRMDCSTMGHSRWRCKVCGHIEEVSGDGGVRSQELQGAGGQL